MATGFGTTTPTQSSGYQTIFQKIKEKAENTYEDLDEVISDLEKNDPNKKVKKLKFPNGPKDFCTYYVQHFKCLYERLGISYIFIGFV